MKKLLSTVLALATALAVFLVVPGTKAATNHTVSISNQNAVVSEDDGIATFTVTLSPPPVAGAGTTYRVTASTSDGSSTIPYPAATAGSDYTATSQQLVWLAGSSVASQTLTVPIAKDGIHEEHEIFTVTLSNPTATGCRGLRCTPPTIAIGDGVSDGIIEDTNPVFKVFAAAIPATVSSDCLLDVELDSDHGNTASVQWAATGATQLITGPTSGQFTFAPGHGAEPLTLDVIKQPKLHSATVTVTLSNPVGGTIGSEGSATCKIKKRPHRGL